MTVLSKPHVTFQVNGYVTTFGQNMFVVGSAPELGSWNTNNAVPLNWVDSDSWAGMVTFTSSKGTTVQYKYIVKNPNGSVIWESDPNHSYAVPNWGDRFVTDTWH
jgi:alpha-amylase